MTVRTIRAILFGDYKEIDAQPEKIQIIFSKLLENGVQVIPGTFQQFNPAFGLGIQERLMFTSSKEKVIVQIGIDTIEINKVIMDNKHYNFKPQTEQFLSQVKKVFKSIISSNVGFNEGRRISLIIEVLHDKENSKIKSLDEIYSSFNNDLPNYSPEETFEWNTRSAKRIHLDILGEQEESNFVTEIQRASGEVNSFGEVQLFDSIQTRIDINTVDSNKKPRINEESINEFLEKAYELFILQNEELEAKIYESN